MYKGFILSESLNNPMLLNDLRKLSVKVEYHPQSRVARYWHNFKITVEDKDIETLTQNIIQEIKYGWYAHFWNGECIFVCLTNRLFKIPQEKHWSSSEYQEMKQYAIENGIEEEYLSFLIED